MLNPLCNKVLITEFLILCSDFSFGICVLGIFGIFFCLSGRPQRKMLRQMGLCSEKEIHTDPVSWQRSVNSMYLFLPDSSHLLSPPLHWQWDVLFPVPRSCIWSIVLYAAPLASLTSCCHWETYCPVILSMSVGYCIKL